MGKQLQAALDLFSLEDALALLRKVGPYVDVVEVGTPLMVAEGARAVSAIKAAWPDVCVFADIKVMDGGSEVPRSVIDAGCDRFSVLAAADDATVAAATDLAHGCGVEVLLDFCAVGDLSARAAELAPLGCDVLCCHVGFDRQATGADPVEELRALSAQTAPKAVAGGIGLGSLGRALESDASIVICGGSLYNAADPEAVAREMRAMVDARNAAEGRW